MAEIGRFSGKSSTSFKQTCNLLSQYIKEKGGFDGLRLGMSSSLDGQADEKFASPVITMDLLPKIEDRRDNLCATVDLNSAPFFSPSFYNSNNIIAGPVRQEKNLPENAQLSIFYGGKVLVFDNFPSDKAKEIVLLAGKADSASGDGFSKISPGEATSSTSGLFQRPLTQIASDLPIMRKNSLHRFLEKRKDRIIAKAPYPPPTAPAPADKPESSKSWLGLSPQT